MGTTNRDPFRVWRDFYNKADFIVDRYDGIELEELKTEFFKGLLQELEESLIELETLLEEDNNGE